MRKRRMKRKRLKLCYREHRCYAPLPPGPLTVIAITTSAGFTQAK